MVFVCVPLDVKCAVKYFKPKADKNTFATIALTRKSTALLCQSEFASLAAQNLSEGHERLFAQSAGRSGQQKLKKIISPARKLEDQERSEKFTAAKSAGSLIF